jgi:hypothetical protein
LIGTVRNVGYKAVRPTRRLPGGESDAANLAEPDTDNHRDPLVDPLRSQ